MRRIIERTVTTVTTTIWKIYWESDTPHSDPSTDPVSNGLPSPEVLSETVQSALPSSTVIELEEVDPSEIEKAAD